MSFALCLACSIKLIWRFSQDPLFSGIDLLGVQLVRTKRAESWMDRVWWPSILNVQTLTPTSQAVVHELSEDVVKGVLFAACKSVGSMATWSFDPRSWRFLHNTLKSIDAHVWYDVLIVVTLLNFFSPPPR